MTSKSKIARMPELRRDLLVRKPWNVRALTGMLHRERAHTALLIDFQQGVLVQIARFGGTYGTKFDVEGVGFLEIFDLHGTKPRSKKALCIVSPSDSSTTRR